MRKAIVVALVTALVACGGSVVSLGNSEQGGAGGTAAYQGGAAGQWIATGGASAGKGGAGYDASANGTGGLDGGGMSPIPGGAPAWSTAPEKESSKAGAPGDGYANTPTGVAVDIGGTVAVSGINDSKGHDCPQIPACYQELEFETTASAFVALFGPSGGVNDCVVVASDGDDAFHGLVFDSEGKLDVVGSVGGPVVLGGQALPFHGNLDALVVQYDKTGYFQWARTYGYEGVQEALAVATDLQRNVLAAGAFEGSIISGADSLNAVGSRSAFLIKLDEDGNWQWGRSWGGGWARAVGVATAPNNDIVVLGAFDGTIELGGLKYTSQGDKDIFLVALDQAGEVRWGKAFGNPEAQEPSRVAVSSKGIVAITGRSRGELDFGGGPHAASVESVFIAEFGSDGVHHWSTAFAVGTETESVKSLTSLAFGEQEELVVTGAFDGVLDLGNGKLQSDSTDIFIAAWSETGIPVWSYKHGSYGAQAPRALAYDPQAGLGIAGVYRQSLNLGAGEMKAYQNTGAMFVARFPAW